VKKFVAVDGLLLFILVMTSWPAFSQDTQKAPQLVLNEREFDFGKVKEGSGITHEFSVQNKGNATLQIKKISHGWGY